MVATQTRRGVGGHNAHADSPARVNAFADGRDISHDFVAKDGGGLDHFGVIAALPNFKVGAVRQRQANTEKHFVGSKAGHVDHLNAQVFAAVQHGRGHLRGHGDSRDGDLHFFTDFRFLWGACSHACAISIFSDSAVGLAASSKASWILSNEKRCVTISITGSFFPSTRSAADSWMSTAAL